MKVVFSQGQLASVGNSIRLRISRHVCGCALAVSLLAPGCSASRNAWNVRSDESQRLVQQAHLAEDRGDNKTAEILLTEAVKSNPTNCETRLELSELLLQHGSMDAAEQQLKRLVEQNPDDPRGYVRLAQVRFHERRYADAKRALDVALELDPAQTEGLLLRGKLEELRQRDDWALEAYHRAMLSETEQIEAEMRIAAIHLKRGQPHQAAPLLRSILESSRACPVEKSTAAWMLGTAYAREERWADSVAAFGAAIPNRRMSAQDWDQVAFAHYRNGNIPEALAANKAALAIAPDSAQSLSMRNALNQSQSAVVSAPALSAPPASTASPSSANGGHVVQAGGLEK